jgi:hypothetical protein
LLLPNLFIHSCLGNGFNGEEIIFLAITGFEVTYTDNTSRVWLSKENNPVPQSVTFTNIKQQSDGSGDYSFFDCNFSCYVYSLNPQTNLVDSLPIQNGKYHGWFKR